jgi:thiol-disulfide isomerase/thioredoxin
MLAGQVLDTLNRRPPPTYIQVVGVDTQGKPAGAPIEVLTTEGGYFTVQGLQPGRHYQLIARAKDGERKLGGTVWATPPNPKVFIPISEDLVTPNQPEVPPSPGAAAPAPDKPSPQWPSEQPPAGTAPGAPAVPSRPVEVLPPRPNGGKPPTPAATGIPQPGDKRYPGAVAINPQVPPDTSYPSNLLIKPQPPREPVIAGPPTGSEVAPSGPTPVPSCVLTGRRLHNFALYDLTGKPWEFRANRRGRLVLLDFWWTGCIPCRQAIPHLNSYQQTYGPYGLEVVSIAYETGALAEQQRKVNSVRDRYHIVYRVLLGTGLQAKCPVREQFQVDSYPTLILLDESGQIVKRIEGVDSQKLRELEFEIRQRLGVR